MNNSIDAKLAKTIVRKQEIIEKALDVNERNEAAAESNASVATNMATEQPATIEVTMAKMEKEAPLLSLAQIQAIHIGLKSIAGMCDGARAEDGCGFNKLDTHIGKSLAAQPALTAKQAVLGKRLCIKYKRQLPADLIAFIGEIPGGGKAEECPPGETCAAGPVGPTAEETEAARQAEERRREEEANTWGRFGAIPKPMPVRPASMGEVDPVTWGSFRGLPEPRFREYQEPARQEILEQNTWGSFFRQGSLF